MTTENDNNKQEVSDETPSVENGAGGEFEVKELEMLKYINATPVVLNLFYEIDLMPEQILAEAEGWEKRRTQKKWFQMLMIAKAIRSAAGERQ